MSKRINHNFIFRLFLSAAVMLLLLCTAVTVRAFGEDGYSVTLSSTSEDKDVTLSYSWTKDQQEGNTGTNIPEGATVTVTATATATKKLTGLTTDVSGVTPAYDSQKDIWTFTMPASNVTLTAAYTTTYPVTINTTSVTDLNKSDVLGDKTVSFDPDTKIITLTGASLSGVNITDTDTANEYKITGTGTISGSEYGVQTAGASVSLVNAVLTVNGTTAAFSISPSSVSYSGDSIVYATYGASSDSTSSTKSPELTVYSGNKYVSIKKYVAISSISIPETQSLVTEGSATLTATINPEDASDKSLTWTSGNPRVVTVKDGILTPVAEGTATVYATSNDNSKISNVCTVTVTKPVTSITVSPTSSTIYVNGTGSYPVSVTLKATTEPEGGAVTWTVESGADCITPSATTDDEITVTAAKQGTATVKASSGSASPVEVTITVGTYTPGGCVVVTPATHTITSQGGTVTISAAVYTDDTKTTKATNQSVYWTSSDSTIATVDNTGRVTAKGNGTATITATWQENSSVTGTSKVTVSAGYGKQYYLYQTSRAWYYDASILSSHIINMTYPYVDSGMSVYIDGNLVSTGNYGVGTISGNGTYKTYLELYSNYLRTLYYGRHYINIRYSDGSYAEGYFWVRSIYDAPLTGDSGNASAWALAMTASASLAAAGAYTLGKKAKKSGAK